MINKIFIDCLEELKSIHNSKKWFKNFHYKIAIDKAFNSIDKYLMTTENIYPAHIGDFVVFLDLAATAGLFENDSYLKEGNGIKIKYELDMNNASDEYIAFEMSIPYKSNSSILKYQFITIFNLEPWDIIYSCSEIEKGVGISGDHIGEFENTSIIINRKRVSNLLVEDDFSDSKSEHIEKNTGYVLLRVMSMSVCTVFMNITKKLIRREYDIFNTGVIKK